MKDEIKKNEEMMDDFEEFENEQEEKKVMKPRKKIFTKRNMVKAAKYVGAFTLGFFVRTGIDMFLGGNETTQATAPDVTTTVVDGVEITKF